MRTLVGAALAADAGQCGPYGAVGVRRVAACRRLTSPYGAIGVDVGGAGGMPTGEVGSFGSWCGEPGSGVGGVWPVWAQVADLGEADRAGADNGRSCHLRLRLSSSDDEDWTTGSIPRILECSPSEGTTERRCI